MNQHAPIARPKATYQDILDAPPDQVAEILYGELSLQPRPSMRHARTASALAAQVGGPFDYAPGPGGWWIVVEPEVHLAEHVLVPDVAGWRREIMPEYPDAAFCTLAPDWVCEVLSPSTRRRDLTEKRDIYGAQGVSHLWLIDPQAQTLEAFALEAGRWTLIAALHGSAAVSAPPFEAISFDLGSLWA